MEISNLKTKSSGHENVPEQVLLIFNVDCHFLCCVSIILYYKLIIKLYRTYVQRLFYVILILDVITYHHSQVLINFCYDLAEKIISSEQTYSFIVK